MATKVSSLMTRATCAACGTEIIWLNQPGYRRPVEVIATPFVENTPGLIYNKRTHQFVDSNNVDPAPRDHNQVHFCKEWRATRNVNTVSDSVADVVEGLFETG